MTNINSEYVNDYIRNLIPDNNEFFQSLEDYARINHIPIVEKEVANLLRLLVKIHQPERILEIGTAIGYSALIMGTSIDKDLEINTIERRQDMIDIAKENIRKTSHKAKINIILGEAEEVMAGLDKKVDFIFLDAAKGHYLDLFNIGIDLLKPGGLIVSDNVLFKGMVANNKLLVRRKITIVKRLRKYLEYISNKPGITTSVLPIGDGVAITYKEE